MDTYILIPHYNRWDLTHARLYEIYKNCKSVKEVIVLDNGSTDEQTPEGLKWWAEFRIKYDFPVSSIRTAENTGFLLGSNFGIRHLLEKVKSDDLVILLSNDVEIRTDFVSQMTDIISQRGNKVLIGGILYTHDTGWNRFGDKTFSYIEGWLLGLTKSGWEELGNGFDERYAPSDFEDIDLSTTALKFGYELVPLNNPGLHHIGGQSIGYTPARLERTNINKKKFQEKWISNE